MDDGNRFGWNWKFLVLNLLVGGNFDINDIIIKETMSKSKIKFLDTRRRQMCVFLCLFAVNVRVCVSVYLCMCVCVWQCAFNTVCTSLRVYMCVCVSLSLSFSLCYNCFLYFELSLVENRREIWLYAFYICLLWILFKIEADNFSLK